MWVSYKGKAISLEFVYEIEVQLFEKEGSNLESYLIFRRINNMAKVIMGFEGPCEARMCLKYIMDIIDLNDYFSIDLEEYLENPEGLDEDEEVEGGKEIKSWSPDEAYNLGELVNAFDIILICNRYHISSESILNDMKEGSWGNSEILFNVMKLKIDACKKQ